MITENAMWFIKQLDETSVDQVKKRIAISDLLIAELVVNCRPSREQYNRMIKDCRITFQAMGWLANAPVIWRWR